MESFLPGSKDVINGDRAIRRMSEAFGVAVEDVATEEEVAAKRQARAAEQQQMKAMQAAQVAGDTYNKTSKNAEPGSPGGKMQEMATSAMGG
jgi:hypothetical protein